METITISLDRDVEDDDIETEERSVAKLRVVDGAGKPVEGARVELHISTDGLFRLGKELIRLSKSIDSIAHLRPSSPSCAVCALGVYLHPDSAELLVIKRDFGTISNALSNLPLSTPRD